MTPAYLLDASAFLALLQGEAGADRVLAVLDQAAIHAVHLAEVVKKLRHAGVAPEFCQEAVGRLSLPVIDEYSAGQAYTTYIYCLKGLSLGDRVGLSVASSLNMTAVTADRLWAELAAANPGWKIHVSLIR